ncbi:tetratricopeptide repeat protein [Ramlibacter sp. PS4R-6]|uniref:tetratricopeptide repeat protein n=1 Tax=Ramlibacter sp. PS4R-6 TaxID=3133438 RepID=UPI0030A82A7F
MWFAGFAKAARGLVTALPVLASILGGGKALAQNDEALRWYTQGLQALEARRFSEARTLLQQAVQADPTFAGAWLDLAIAANADGDPVEAEEFLAILEARFAVPPVIAQRVSELRSVIQRRRNIEARAWVWSAMLQAGTGFDTNANAGLAQSDLTLTFPGGSVVLPIADTQRPRHDGYFASSMLVEGQRPSESGQYEVAASLRSRANAHLHAYDTIDFQTALAYAGGGPAFDGRVPFVAGPWRVAATLQRLWLGNSTLLDSASFSAVHAWPSLRCTPQGGIELSVRHFPVASNLDSHLVWLTGSATCDSPWAGPGARTTAQVRVGYESGRGNFATPAGRPGDDTRHYEATLLQRWGWEGRQGNHRVEAQVQWARAEDTQGYSPLLASNAARRVSRWTGALSYSHPLGVLPVLGGGWLATGTLQAFRQQSNLELFRLRGEVIQLSLQKNW